jgi:hypothetical protein
LHPVCGALAPVREKEIEDAILPVRLALGGVVPREGTL